MCFDARSSMEAFIISSIGTSMLYFSADKTKQKISYFWMSVTLIQLWEYFIWKNINNKEKNRFWSTILRTNISLQPLIGLLVLISLPSYLPRHVLISILFIELIVLIRWFYNIYRESEQVTKVSNNNHLDWPGGFVDMQISNILPTIVYLIVLTILPWFVKPLKTGLSFGMLIALSLVLSILKLEHFNIINSSGWRSIWCYVAASIPLIQSIII